MSYFDKKPEGQIGFVMPWKFSLENEKSHDQPKWKVIDHSFMGIVRDMHNRWEWSTLPVVLRSQTTPGKSNVVRTVHRFSSADYKSAIDESQLDIGVCEPMNSSLMNSGKSSTPTPIFLIKPALDNEGMIYSSNDKKGYYEGYDYVLEFLMCVFLRQKPNIESNARTMLHAHTRTDSDSDSLFNNDNRLSSKRRKYSITD